MPLISVAIPAYNYGRYLPCAIASVLAQDHAEIELLIVDDCSTDDTPAVVAPFLADPRVRYLRNDSNLGAVRNINKAVAETRGPFVLLLGADDFLLPGCLSALLAALDRHPEAGFAYGNYVVADENDRILEVIQHPGHIPADLPPWRDDFGDLLCFDDYINMGTALFRRAVIDRHGFFDPLLSIDDLPGRFFRATDWDLCLRLALAEVRSSFVYSTLSAFRVHSTQASVGGDFDSEGIGLREFLVLLERYLQPENAPRLAGRAAAISALLKGKISALLAQADPARIADSETLRARIAHAENFLQQLRTQRFAEAAPDLALAVIVIANDNPQDLLPTLADLQQQTLSGAQILVINRGRMNLAHLVHPARHLRITGISAARARRYGVHLSTAEGISFIEAGSRLPTGHLAQLAASLGQPGVELVQAETTWPATGDSSSWQSALAALLPATHPWRSGPPPLSAFALRRALYHRLGGFNETLGVLDDLDFLLRLQREAQITPAASRIDAVPMLTSMLRTVQESGQADIVARSLQAIAERQSRG